MMWPRSLCGYFTYISSRSFSRIQQWTSLCTIVYLRKSSHVVCKAKGSREKKRKWDRIWWATNAKLWVPLQQTDHISSWPLNHPLVPFVKQSTEQAGVLIFYLLHTYIQMIHIVSCGLYTTFDSCTPGAAWFIITKMMSLNTRMTYIVTCIVDLSNDCRFVMPCRCVNPPRVAYIRELQLLSKAVTKYQAIANALMYLSTHRNAIESRMRATWRVIICLRNSMMYFWWCESWWLSLSLRALSWI